MTITQCAEIVQRGDPDRFLAVMAAPVPAREILFPIYAFNVEAARAPYVTEEPMIAEMRLQWWWDALEEIATGGQVRAHEVTTPLAAVLDDEGARLLQNTVDARRRDARREDPKDLDAVENYIRATSGVLMWVAARALGTDAALRARAELMGSFQGLANYLLAVPQLRDMGRQPFPPLTPQDFKALIEAQFQALKGLKPPSKPLKTVELSSWRAKRILRRAYQRPDAVGQGRLVEPEFVRRGSLLWRSLWV